MALKPIHLPVGRSSIRAIALTCVLASVAACQKLPTYRYKITVEVQTPQGIRTGSAVREVASHTEPRITPEMGGVHVALKGEAVVVPLSNGKSVYALLTADDASGFPAAVAEEVLGPAGGYPRGPYADIVAYLASHRVRGIVPPRAYPKFVSFTDKRDPKTVYLVKPKSTPPVADNEVLIKKISIETAGEAVTRSIEKDLPWLVWLRTSLMGSVSYYPNVLADSMGRSAFVK